jgi:hypothetical protein
LVSGAKGMAKTLRRRSLLPARFILDEALVRTARGANGRILRLALVSDQTVSTSEEQFSPFEAHRAELRSRLGVTFVRMHVSDVLWAPRLALAPFDVIVVKLGFRTPAEEAVRVVAAIRQAVGSKRVMYFDGDDDLCVLWPEIIQLVDLYVKKHVFRERARYRREYVGKSNLTDYVHRVFGHSFADDPVATRTDPVSSGDVGKIVAGWNLALDHKIKRMYAVNGFAELGPRPNDVVCRAGVPKDWIQYLRRDVEPLLRSMQNRFRVIVPNQRVDLETYLKEMLESRICVGPFGYGEICWRDFEAVLCGCLLVKPDMSHVETYPDIYQAFRTYVPVRWDLSDLVEKCEYYLGHDEERERIARCAQQVLRDFYQQDGFLNRLCGLLRPASVASRDSAI